MGDEVERTQLLHAGMFRPAGTAAPPSAPRRGDLSVRDPCLSGVEGQTFAEAIDHKLQAAVLQLRSEMVAGEQRAAQRAATEKAEWKAALETLRGQLQAEMGARELQDDLVEIFRQMHDEATGRLQAVVGRVGGQCAELRTELDFQEARLRSLDARLGQEDLAASQGPPGARRLDIGLPALAAMRQPRVAEQLSDLESHLSALTEMDVKTAEAAGEVQTKLDECLAAAQAQGGEVAAQAERLQVAVALGRGGDFGARSAAFAREQYDQVVDLTDRAPQASGIAAAPQQGMEPARLASEPRSRAHGDGAGGLRG